MRNQLKKKCTAEQSSTKKDGRVSLSREHDSLRRDADALSMDISTFNVPVGLVLGVTTTVEAKVPSLSNNQDTSWVRNCEGLQQDAHLKVVENDIAMKDAVTSQFAPLISENSDQIRPVEHHPVRQHDTSRSR